MKPNLAQLQNCTQIPYGCLHVETQHCVEYPAGHNCHTEMQAKLIFYSNHQFRMERDSKQCWIFCSHFRPIVITNN